MNELWLHATANAYDLAVLRGNTKMEYRFVQQLAESVLNNFPTTAHLYVLERLHVIGENHEMWRQVLTELDKLEAQNGREVGEHISRREGEPQDDEQELRDADDGNTWKPSTPNSVDESAL